MRKIRLFTIIILFSFVLSSVGFCDAAGMTDDGSHHCIMSCHAGCHISILSSYDFTISLAPSATVILPNSAFPQYSLIRNIEQPPKSII